MLSFYSRAHKETQESGIYPISRPFTEETQHKDCTNELWRGGPTRSQVSMMEESRSSKKAESRERAQTSLTTHLAASFPRCWTAQESRRWVEPTGWFGKVGAEVFAYHFSGLRMSGVSFHLLHLIAGFPPSPSYSGTKLPHRVSSSISVFSPRVLALFAFSHLFLPSLH